jgi:hypothetical protein
MRKLLLLAAVVGGLAVPGAAMADRADSGTLTYTCTDNTTGAIFFQFTADANSTQGQNLVLEVQKANGLDARFNATCGITFT